MKGSEPQTLAALWSRVSGTSHILPYATLLVLGGPLFKYTSKCLGDNFISCLPTLQLAALVFRTIQPLGPLPPCEQRFGGLSDIHVCDRPRGLGSFYFLNMLLAPTSKMILAYTSGWREHGIEISITFMKPSGALNNIGKMSADLKSSYRMVWQALHGVPMSGDYTENENTLRGTLP